MIKVLSKFILTFSMAITMAIISFCQPVQPTGVFFQDTSVRDLAQEYDSLYFGFFIEALKGIKEKNHKMIEEFFDLEKRSGKRKKIQLDSEKLTRNITPVFKSYKVRPPLIWSDSIHEDPSWRLWYYSLIWLNPFIASGHIDSNLVAFVIVDDWIKNHLSYPDKKARFSFDDHAISERLVVLQQTYNKFKQSSLQNDEFEERLQLSILSHIFFVVSLEKYLSWHNHAIIFDEKLITALNELNEFTLREDFLEFAFTRLFEQYRYSFTREGIHKEHSPCYHKFFTNKLNHVLNIAKENNIEVPEEITDIQQKANTYLSLLSAREDLKIGDCAYTASKKMEIGRWSEGQNNRIYCSIFPVSGWAFIFDTIYGYNVVIQSDFFSYSHYHKDETSFILSVSGRELIIDPGLYSYKKNQVYKFYRSAYAHNVLIVDGADFKSNINNTGLSGITRFYIDTVGNKHTCGVIEMTHPHYLDLGVEIFRQIAFINDEEIVVKDIVYAKESHVYKQLFHLAPGAKVVRSDKRFIISWPDHPDTLVITSNEESFSIVTGQKEPLQGWNFPERYKMEKAPVLILEKRSDSCEFTTHINIYTPFNKNNISSSRDRQIKDLYSKIKATGRRDLIHLPFPERWKSLRDN